jgi:type I restriction enzyme R subunit
MTDKITENAIETFCIELLEKQGYEYIYAPDIAPDSEEVFVIGQ